jgi:UPF0755 protein
MTTTPVTEDQVESPEPSNTVPGWVWAIAKFFGAVAVVALIAVVGYNGALWLADAVSPTPSVAITPGLEVTVVVPPGSSARAISSQLEEKAVIADGSDFLAEVERLGATDQLRAGTYVLVSGADYDVLIAELVAGAPTEAMRLTVIEGLRIEEMLASIAAQTPHTVDELSAVLLDGTVDSAFLPETTPAGMPELTRWEGLLSPDTYEFNVDASPEAILQRLADTLASRVDTIDWSELEERGLTPYDGLIIASLIEKEAKLEEERPLISSVIHNRLERDQALQIDATIIYALDNGAREVTYADLEIDSPYNTYQRFGLPPTPISGVRVASLQAAGNPAETAYLYYVLVDKDGTHGFSETLAQHEALKRQAKEDGVLTP